MSAARRRIIRAMPLPERVAYWRLEDVLGCKWTTAVLGAIGDGVTRPYHLERFVAGISKKILYERLRKLERFGLIRKAEQPSRRAHVDYCLTRAGVEVHRILRRLRKLQGLWPPTPV